eukprot:95632_1
MKNANQKKKRNNFLNSNINKTNQNTNDTIVTLLDTNDTDLTKHNRRSLCIDVLSEGFINSYIEFFYLSHRYNENNELQKCNMSEEELIYLKENLVMAELSKRKSDFFKTHKAYKNIGDFFKQNKEYESAIYFYNKCHNIFSDENNIIESEQLQEMKLITYLDLGLTYESLKEINFAIKFHEQYLEICTILSRENEIKFANRNLIRTFKLQSDELTKNGKYDEAMSVLEKCIFAGQSAHDLNGESIAQKTLGNIFYKLKQYKKATICYKKYLKICIELDNKKGEGNAYLNLGRSYQQIGDNVLATKYFESYMNVASIHNELQSESEAALALGDIYCNNNNEQDKAIKYYTKNFELSRKLNLKEQINDARIKIGIAKSKQQIDDYVNLINSSSENTDELMKLLRWKNKREPINDNENIVE